MERQPRPGDAFAKVIFGRNPQECYERAECVCCGGPAIEFKDKLSEKEYGISVFCQECQDKTFSS